LFLKTFTTLKEIFQIEVEDLNEIYILFNRNFCSASLSNNYQRSIWAPCKLGVVSDYSITFTQLLSPKSVGDKTCGWTFIHFRHFMQTAYKNISWLAVLSK
jgi:hypothetical protein